MCKNRINAIISTTGTFLVLLLVFVVTDASSATNNNQKIGEYSDWGLFTTVNDKGEKVCYVASLPKSKEGNYRRRGEAFLTVTLVDGEKNAEVSTSSGYFYKKDTEVDVRIGNRGFIMYPYEERAWLISESEDTDMINAMAKGVRAVIKGTSTLDTYSKDTYSLIGFTEAYNNMEQICHKKI